MLADPAVEDLFIAWFVVLGAINLFDMLQRDISLPSRVGAFFHVLMCVAMAAMTHPLFMDYWKLHAAVFTGAALWFAVIAGWPTWNGSRGDHDSGERCLAAGGHRIRSTAWYHAFMMAAMSWMTWIMLVLHDDHSGHNMATHHASGMSPMMMALPFWMLMMTLVAIVVFAVFTVVYVWRLLRAGSLNARLHSGAQAGMAAGMAFGFVGM